MAEVFAEDRQTAGHARRPPVEELSSGASGAGIRVVIGETTGFAHTSDLSEAGSWRRPRPRRRWPGEGGGGRTVALRSGRRPP
jgi:TldD protein